MYLLPISFFFPQFVLLFQFFIFSLGCPFHLQLCFAIISLLVAFPILCIYFFFVTWFSFHCDRFCSGIWGFRFFFECEVRWSFFLSHNRIHLRPCFSNIWYDESDDNDELFQSVWASTCKSRPPSAYAGCCLWRVKLFYFFILLWVFFFFLCSVLSCP